METFNRDGRTDELGKDVLRLFLSAVQVCNRVNGNSADHYISD